MSSRSLAGKVDPHMDFFIVTEEEKRTGLAKSLSGLPPGMNRSFAGSIAVPESDWPLWAKALKLLAKPEDKGIGDVVARTIGSETSQAFKTWFKKTFNRDCGCAGRHAQWNAMYPL